MTFKFDYRFSVRNAKIPWRGLRAVPPRTNPADSATDELSIHNLEVA